VLHALLPPGVGCWCAQVCQEAEEAVEELRSQDVATREQLNSATASLQVGQGLCTVAKKAFKHSRTEPRDVQWQRATVLGVNTFDF